MSDEIKSKKPGSGERDKKYGDTLKEAKKPQVTIHHYGNDYEPGKPNSVPAEHYVNFNLAPGEYLVQCPYNKSHRILPHRMGRHIFRCRKNYEDELKKEGTGIRWVVCPWTEHHLLPEIEMEYHAAQCDYRGKTKEELEAFKRYCPKKPDYGELENLITEGWNDEIEKPVNTGTYDPRKKLETQPIIYFGPKGMNKSTKREFRDAQRLKFFHLVSGPFWQHYRSGVHGTNEESQSSSKTNTSDTVGLNNVPPSDNKTEPYSNTDSKLEDADGMVARFVKNPFEMQELNLKDDKTKQKDDGGNPDRPGPSMHRKA